LRCMWMAEIDPHGRHARGTGLLGGWPRLLTHGAPHNLGLAPLLCGASGGRGSRGRRGKEVKREDPGRAFALAPFNQPLLGG
jgi:hypothetical protein